MTKEKTTLIQEDPSKLPTEFPEKQKGCRKGPRDTAELLYIDQYILNKDKTRQEKNLAIDWLQKTHGSAKMDNKLPQNVQNITWSQTLLRKPWKPGEEEA